MATKQTPPDGLIYDAQTHEWKPTSAPAPTPAPAEQAAKE